MSSSKLNQTFYFQNMLKRTLHPFPSGKFVLCACILKVNRNFQAQSFMQKKNSSYVSFMTTHLTTF